MDANSTTRLRCWSGLPAARHWAIKKKPQRWSCSALRHASQMASEKACSWGSGLHRRSWCEYFTERGRCNVREKASPTNCSMSAGSMKAGKKRYCSSLR